MPVSVGFTGTQNGVTQAQEIALRYLFSELKIDWLHHGDCIGADAKAHEIALSLGTFIVIHPPINNVKRAYCKEYTRIMSELPYLVRNKRIVDFNPILVAAPSGPEKLRSGTWSTVRYARKRKRNIYIVWPDGSITKELHYATASYKQLTPV